MSFKSKGGKQVQDPQLVTLEGKINELEDEKKELKGKTDAFSQQCYLKLQDEIVELRKNKNLLIASAMTTAQQEATHVQSLQAPSSGLLDCILGMTIREIVIDEEEVCQILECNKDCLLSRTIKEDIPNNILVRQSVSSIFNLVADAMLKDLGKFVITGTPGIGKTVSIFIFLYLLVNNSLPISFNYIVIDLDSYRILFSRKNLKSDWVDEILNETSIHILRTTCKDVKEALYLYDATDERLPLTLPFKSIVFSSPNLKHFKEFIKTRAQKLKIYYVPKWDIDEICVYFNNCTDLYQLDGLELDEILSLFYIWNGVPRQIFSPLHNGVEQLETAIENCDVIACINSMEKGKFLAYTEKTSKEIYTKLMQLDVVKDGTFEKAFVNFGSPRIRDMLVKKSGDSLTDFYRDFMKLHGKHKYGAKVRGNLYERLVLDQLRRLSDGTDMEVLFFELNNAGIPNSDIQKVSLLSMPCHQPRQYSSLKEIDEANGVWIPNQSNFKSFDGLIFHGHLRAWWLQITVAQEHPLNVTGAHECVQHTNTTFSGIAEIIFCLPPDIFEEWYRKNSRQHFVTASGTKALNHQYLSELKQIVVCIPGDEIENQNKNALWDKYVAERHA